MFVSPESAELAKYAANAFLAMKVTFINEVADLCEAVGADVQEVATAIGADGRIGSKFLHAGPGYGGSCFPKDVTALIRTAREAKSPLSLVEQVEKVNTERKIAMAGRIEAALGGSVRDKTVGVLGVTFKPNTDDMREAPSLVIFPMLQARGARIRAYDPQGRSKAQGTAARGSIGATARWTPVEGADVLVVLTEWNEFRALDLKRVRTRCSATCWSICAMSTSRLSPRPRASFISASAAVWPGVSPTGPRRGRASAAIRLDAAARLRPPSEPRYARGQCTFWPSKTSRHSRRLSRSGLGLMPKVLVSFSVDSTE